jgi:alkyl hydroperoxide reductase subunit AhpC
VDTIAEEHQVITVAMQSGTRLEVAQHLDKKGWNFPVIADPTGDIARTWGVRGVPALYFLDRENLIHHVSVGYTSRPGMSLRMWMAK